MSHPVNWFQIQGPNAHALQAFYKQVFGWKMQSMPGGGDSMMVAAEPEGIPGGVGTSHNHQPNVSVFISVGDIDAVFGKIQRAGGRMVQAKQELPGNMGAIAEFHDPAGNAIGLWMAPKKKAAAPKKKAAAKKKAAPKKVAVAKKVAAPKKKAVAKKVAAPKTKAAAKKKK